MGQVYWPKEQYFGQSHAARRAGVIQPEYENECLNIGVSGPSGATSVSPVFTL